MPPGLPDGFADGWVYDENDDRGFPLDVETWKVQDGAEFAFRSTKRHRASTVINGHT